MIDLLIASTVLIIGDSHSVGPFGWYLDENLRQSGHKVATYASCGSIANWWMTAQKTTCGYYSNDINNNITRADSHPTPKLESLLDQVRPDAVIVELGSNYVKSPDDQFVKEDLRKFVSMIKAAGAKCFWVTAPDMRLYRNELPRLNKLLSEAVGESCTLFDSQKVTSYPAVGGDGVHYWFNAGLPEARKWSDGVFEQFTAFSQQF